MIEVIMALTMIFDPASYFLWATAIILTFITAILYLHKARLTESKNERLVGYSLVAVLIGLGMVRTFFYFSHFFVQGEYIGLVYYGDFSANNEMYDLLVELGYISFYIGFFCLSVVFERIIKTTKYIFSAIYGLLIVLIIFTTHETARNMVMSIGMLLTSMNFVHFMYVYSKRSSQEDKLIFNLFMFGATLVIYAFITDMVVVKVYNLVPLYLPPIVYLIGMMIMMIPNLMSSRFFERPLKYSKLFGALSVAIGWASLTLMFLLHIFNIATVTAIFTNIIYSSIIYFSIKDLKPGAMMEKADQGSGYLSIFRRNSKVSEEEVSIAKEKMICLTCKNKLKRDIYLCPTCKAFYCQKCSQALSSAENACWVCQAPFDESKPVNIQTAEEDIVDMSLDKGQNIHK